MSEHVRRSPNGRFASKNSGTPGQPGEKPATPPDPKPPGDPGKPGHPLNPGDPDNPTHPSNPNYPHNPDGPLERIRDPLPPEVDGDKGKQYLGDGITKTDGGSRSQEKTGVPTRAQ